MSDEARIINNDPQPVLTLNDPPTMTAVMEDPAPQPLPVMIDEQGYAPLALDAPQLASHPIADVLPMMTEAQLTELTESIELSGQKDPVVLFEGKILDGRNRVEACRRLGRSIEWTGFQGTTAAAVEFVTETNLQRREMNASQKACAAVDLIPYLKEGVHEARSQKLTEMALAREQQRRESTEEAASCINAQSWSEEVRTAALAADIFGVSARYVGYAQQLQTNSPEAFATVKAGSKSLTSAITEITGATETEAEVIRKLYNGAKRLAARAEGYPEVRDLFTQAAELLAGME